MHSGKMDCGGHKGYTGRNETSDESEDLPEDEEVTIAREGETRRCCHCRAWCQRYRGKSGNTNSYQSCNPANSISPSTSACAPYCGPKCPSYPPSPPSPSPGVNPCRRDSENSEESEICSSCRRDEEASEADEAYLCP